MELEALAQSLQLGQAVVFTGSVPHEAIPQYLAAMDITVAPFQDRKELLYGSPIKLVEYMAMERPIVAAAVGQIKETIRHHQTGWLYPAGDDSKLADALETLLREPELAARLGRAAREEVALRHTWEAVASQIINIAEINCRLHR